MATVSGTTRTFAYAHLLHLAEVCAIQGEVIFAVPGSFTHQQLAILLGLAKQTPFTVIGVVDSSAAAAATQAKSAQVIYLDLQLHQALVSSLELEARRIADRGHRSGSGSRQSEFHESDDANGDKPVYPTVPF